MAVLSTRNPRLVILLLWAVITATDLRFLLSTSSSRGGSSIFVVAIDRVHSTNHTRTVALEQADDEGNICQEKTRYYIKRRRKRYKICDWVALKKEKRCNKVIIKLKRRRKKIRKIHIETTEYCGCTCAIDAAPSCPDGGYDPITNVDDHPCDGFEANRECGYGHIWMGCNYADLRCKPVTNCTCVVPIFESPDDDRTPVPYWSCSLNTPDYCPDPTRPSAAPTAYIPPIPPERHTPCQPGDPKPEDPVVI